MSRFLVVFFLLFALGPTLTAEDLIAAKALYEKRCAQCHGMEGKGDGPAAAFVDPKPRDFTRGQYKFRTTQSGELPTDEDLLKVVSNGVHGTSMTSFKEDLSPEERKQVVAYVKGFYPGFAKAGPQAFPAGKPLKAGPPEKGQELYQKMLCASCHGAAGRGNGGSAFTLKDAVGNPIFPANLNQNWNFRGGGTVEDIYTRLMTGLNGTPMPSYADALESEQDRWALAHYVHSLSRPQNPSSVVQAHYVDGDLPLDPKSDKWDGVPFVDFPLVGQVVTEPRLFTPSVGQVSVKALYNDKAVSFLLYWDDRTSSLAAGATTYADAFALQFPTGLYDGKEKPYFLGGDPAHPVNLWFWQNGSTPAEANSIRLAQWVVQPEAGQRLAGAAAHDDGRWWLVVSRELVSETPEQDVRFAVGEFTPVAFFAWDGYNGDNGARCSISAWYDVVLKPKTPLRAYAFPSLAVVLVGGLQWWGVRRLKKNRSPLA